MLSFTSTPPIDVRLYNSISTQMSDLQISDFFSKTGKLSVKNKMWNLISSLHLISKINSVWHFLSIMLGFAVCSSFYQFVFCIFRLFLLFHFFLYFLYFNINFEGRPNQKLRLKKGMEVSQVNQPSVTFNTETIYKANERTGFYIKPFAETI